MRVGIAQRPKPGEAVCGDSYAVVEQPSGLLLMLCDGTGHGPRAAEASSLAAEHVREHADQDLATLMAGCGDKLRGTRGGAVALLRLDNTKAKIDFLSVGNVELRGQCEVPVAPICSPGMVGRPVRKLHPFSYTLSPGDRLVLFSDGISRAFELEPVRELSAQRAAERILAEHGLSRDDASCVVVDNRSDEEGSTLSAREQEEVHIIESEADVIVCGAEVRRLARDAGLADKQQQLAAIVARELASNIHKYAERGKLCARTIHEGRVALELRAEDRGPGIADVERALRDGYSEAIDGCAKTLLRERGRSLGVGLGAVQRMTDEMTILTRVGGGTRIIVRIHARPPEGASEG